MGNTPPIPEQAWQGLSLEVCFCFGISILSPSLLLTISQDSPLGVRFADFVTVFPTGINAAATWNRNLIRQRGVGMGQEHKGSSRCLTHLFPHFFNSHIFLPSLISPFFTSSLIIGKGVHIALGPMMNMGRIAQGGRNWEGFGADPFLAGEVAYETVLGMQSGGVQATAKHFINK